MNTQKVITTCFTAIGIGVVGWFLMPQQQHIATVFHCGEPIVIEACEQKTLYPDCRIRNVAQVPLGAIEAWAYDQYGVRVGSSLDQIDLHGLPAGRTVNTKVMPLVNANVDIGSIVLCSVDPESPLGSKRFGIGATVE